MNVDQYLIYSAKSDSELVNCWEFVRWVLFNEFKIQLPTFNRLSVDTSEILDQIKTDQLQRDWYEVSVPTYGDVVVFMLYGIRPHIGVMLDDKRVLHFKNNKSGAMIESIFRSNWRQRIDGFYRNKQFTR